MRLINFPITQADCLYGYIEDYNKSSMDQDSYFGMINNTNQNLDQIEDDSLENRYPFLINFHMFIVLSQTIMIKSTHLLLTLLEK